MQSHKIALSGIFFCHGDTAVHSFIPEEFLPVPHIPQQGIYGTLWMWVHSYALIHTLARESGFCWPVTAGLGAMAPSQLLDSHYEI